MNTEPKMTVDVDGTQRWCVYGLLHREDGPAMIFPDGEQLWYLNGELHRTDGPAMVWPDTQSWYLNGKKYDFANWLAALDSDDKTKTLLALKWSSQWIQN